MTIYDDIMKYRKIFIKNIKHSHVIKYNENENKI